MRDEGCCSPRQAVSTTYCPKVYQVWYMWFLGLVKSAASTALLLVAARLAACVWGENYWLIGWTYGGGLGPKGILALELGLPLARVWQRRVVGVLEVWDVPPL